jgi:hypothetical protein
LADLTGYFLSHGVSDFATAQRKAIITLGDGAYHGIWHMPTRSRRSGAAGDGGMPTAH